MAVYPDPLQTFNPDGSKKNPILPDQKYDFTDPDIRNYLKGQHTPTETVQYSTDVNCAKDKEVYPCKTVQRLRKSV